MSIYVTLWEAHIPAGDDPSCERWDGDESCSCAPVYAQGVPAHIDYAGEIWDDWLPPPVEDRGGNLRAVVVCGPRSRKGTARNGQEYVDPVLVLTGPDYESIRWDDLYWRLVESLAEQAA